MKYPKISDSTADKLIKAGLLVAAYFIGKKLLANAAQDSADSQIDTDPAAGQARALNAAMNRSGINALREVDGTNEKAIYEIAGQITNLDKVKDYYKAQTQGRKLHEDLTKELGADGYDKFLAIATKGKSGSIKYAAVRPDIKPKLWVLTKAEANIRKTAKKESKYLPGNNIVKLVSKGKLLGITTGKFAYDETNDVTFLEFYTLGAKQAGKHFFFVAYSQVELISNEEKIKREKDGKIPLEILAGLSGLEDSNNNQLVSIRSTTIFDEQFNPLATASANRIIGFPVLTLTTERGRFIKLQTVQGNIRWVNAEDIKIIERG